jgi:hypothetical protein
MARECRRLEGLYVMTAEFGRRRCREGWHIMLLPLTAEERVKYTDNA